MDGWRMIRCEEPCPDGTHGQNCSDSCRCQNGGTCNPINGKCFCNDGWTVFIYRSIWFIRSILVIIFFIDLYSFLFIPIHSYSFLFIPAYYMAWKFKKEIIWRQNFDYFEFGGKFEIWKNIRNYFCFFFLNFWFFGIFKELGILKKKKKLNLAPNLKFEKKFEFV